ncbi:MAG: 30S ribosome-binding factor RbfA [Bacteroidetes bacterium]|nr:30S ribosome-binding factor RbfA [Bacteroidota bacterium]MCY4224509.1 30S ribosome-binding factor RbfA [Bacteroidota bacterium]
MSVRTQRVAKMIHREISEILARQFSDSSMITVTGVRITRDLSIVDVDLSIMVEASHERRKVFDSVDGQVVTIRKLLAQRVRHQMRAVPTIRFSLDESQEHIQKMDALFEKINGAIS